MKRYKAPFGHSTLRLLSFAILATALPLSGQYWTSFDNNTRYLALGDSISAGYGAKPITQGFTHQLYESGAIDKVNNLIFCPVAVPNALSLDVVNFQLPMAKLCFAPTGTPYSKVVTLSAGGNDAFLVLEQGIPPMVVFGNLVTNLTNIIGTLKGQHPGVKIYVMNYYDPRLPIPGGRDLVLALNATIAAVIAGFQSPDVVLVDVFKAFEDRKGLLLVERTGAAPLEIHPTNAGYQVITATFKKAIKGE